MTTDRKLTPAEKALLYINRNSPIEFIDIGIRADLRLPGGMSGKSTIRLKELGLITIEWERRRANRYRYSATIYTITDAGKAAAAKLID